MEDRSFGVFLASAAALLVLGVGGAGFIAGAKEMWPYEALRSSEQVVSSLLEHGEVVADGRRRRAPEGAARDDVAVHDASAAIGEGFYAVMGWDGNLSSYSVRLYDAAGAVAHVWPVDETSISERAQHRENGPHAMEVLDDGSVIVSFDWLGLMARLDPCGDALWSMDGFYHHSFSPAADGGLWTWYGEGSSYGQVQDIVKFDPMSGEVTARIDFAQDVALRSPEAALVFSLPPDYRFVPDDEDPRDIFHPNDVEELLPEMADAFPQFEVGDLMLSIRELDLVTVISPEGGMKWYRHGPWLMQHDPDFEPDGRISVFNNSLHRPESSIVTVDPQTGTVTDALPSLDAPFKSNFRGKHQLLPNGNRLITIPEQGQAIEVTPDGDVAVEFNNVVPGQPEWNDDLVNAKWLPAGHFAQMPACDAPS